MQLEEPSCRATTVSRLCLSAALLLLLGTLVASTPEGDKSNKDSLRPAFCLQLHTPVPAGSCSPGTSTTPCPGSAWPLLTADAEGSRTTSWMRRSVSAPVVAATGPRRVRQLCSLRCWSPRRPHMGLGCGCFWAIWISSASFSSLPSSAEPCLSLHCNLTLTPLPNVTALLGGGSDEICGPALSISGGRSLFSKEAPLPHSDVAYLFVASTSGLI